MYRHYIGEHTHFQLKIARGNIVIWYMKHNKCGLGLIILVHPLKLVAFTDAVFKAQPEEATGLVFRGSVAVLCEDRRNVCKFHSSHGKVDFIDFTMRRQRRVVRSMFSAELNGLVDSIEQVLLLQCTFIKSIAAQHRARRG